MNFAKMWYSPNGGWKLAVVDSTGHKWLKILTLGTTNVKIDKVLMLDDPKFRDTNVSVMEFINRALSENLNGDEREITPAVIESFDNIIGGMANDTQTA